MIYILLVLLGVSIGSFVSVVSYRLPKDLGFIADRSFCDNCKRKLEWYDNIPLVSFLLYKGKSRCCNRSISIRYPIIELISAIGIVSLYFLLPVFQLFIIYYSIFTLSLIVMVIDLENQIIPDSLSWILLLLILLISENIFIHLFTGFVLALIILFLHLITKGRGMGLGDVKLTLALGSYFLLFNGLKWLTLSFVLGGLISIFLLVLNKAKLKTKVAFGPFLILGFWLAVFLIK